MFILTFDVRLYVLPKIRVENVAYFRVLHSVMVPDSQFIIYTDSYLEERLTTAHFSNDDFVEHCQC